MLPLKEQECDDVVYLGNPRQPEWVNGILCAFV